MKLLLVRHAPAGDPAAYAASGMDDRERPLTPEGKRKMRRAARGLARLIPSLDLLASSPLVRAVQTADILASCYRRLDVTPTDELVPGRPPDRVLRWLSTLPIEGVVAAVGHEPDLSRLAAFLLTGQTAPFLEFKKGGAALLDLAPGSPPGGRGGGARLEWLLAPGQLRRLKG